MFNGDFDPSRFQKMVGSEKIQVNELNNKTSTSKETWWSRSSAGESHVFVLLYNYIIAGRFV